ncbi:MAG: hypothetical protein N3F05_02695 [Candidatus Diapherotrites archaeon]|nr:hypothetical protein [Candidatus Diapherotrites archaeon]
MDYKIPLLLVVVCIFSFVAGILLAKYILPEATPGQSGGFITCKSQQLCTLEGSDMQAYGCRKVSDTPCGMAYMAGYKNAVHAYCYDCSPK